MHDPNEKRSLCLRAPILRQNELMEKHPKPSQYCSAIWRRRAANQCANATRVGAKMYNVVVHGIAFMIIFSAFQTASEYAQPILEDQDLGDLGFQSAAVIYLSLACANIVAPAVVEKLGPKKAMIVGASLYLVYLASFLKPTRATVLLSSVVLGFGGAVLWAAQGVFLIENSDPRRRGRDTGIFWALLQCRLLIGNAVAYNTLAESGTTEAVNASDAHRFYFLLLLLGIAGVSVLFCLRRREGQQVGESNINPEGAHQTSSILHGVNSMYALFRTKQVQSLAVCFVYTGLVLTFWSGKYFELMAGHMDSWMWSPSELNPFNAQIVAVGGVCVGIGEIIGGLGSGFIADRFGRVCVYAGASVCHFAAFVFCLFAFSNRFADVSDVVHIRCAYAVGALLGLGDASLNTAMYSLLGDMSTTVLPPVDTENGTLEQGSKRHSSSVPLIASFKLVQSLAATVAFFYSGSAPFMLQVGVLVSFLCVGTFCFATQTTIVAAAIRLEAQSTHYAEVKSDDPATRQKSIDPDDTDWEANREERLKFLA